MTRTKILVPICLYCLNCMKFGQLILRKMIKIVATRCHILRLKCTKFDFGWGSAPDPAGGDYSAPPNPLAGFKGPTSKGREGGWRREGMGGEGKRRERKAKGRGKGNGREVLPQRKICHYITAHETFWILLLKCFSFLSLQASMILTSIIFLRMALAKMKNLWSFSYIYVALFQQLFIILVVWRCCLTNDVYKVFIHCYL